MIIDVPIIQFDFSGGAELDEIKRCLHALYSTHAGTQPLDRELGLSMNFLDYPAPIVKNRYALEVIQKTAKYEPRVKVVSVTYKNSANPEHLHPVILIGRGEEF